MALRTRERALVLLAGALLVFLTALPLCAQTVRPLLSEYKEVARGRVELVNDSAFPLTAVASARSFHVSETGEISYAPLNPGIHLKLSAMSFRVRPQQSYYLFYEARADKLPAWFVIYVGFSGFPVRDTSGLNVQVDLPHTVYLLPKRGMQKAELQVQARYSQADHKLVIDAANTGDSFGRAQSVETIAGRTRQEASGFPLFPHARRRLEMHWDSQTAPQKVKVKLADYSVEAPVRSMP